jgi:hypothetical protein
MKNSPMSLNARRKSAIDCQLKRRNYFACESDGSRAASSWSLGARGFLRDEG